MNVNNLKRPASFEIEEPGTKRQKIESNQTPEYSLSNYIQETYGIIPTLFIGSGDAYTFAVGKLDHKLIKLLYKAQIEFDEDDKHGNNLLLSACKIWSLQKVQDLKAVSKTCIGVLIKCKSDLLHANIKDEAALDIILDEQIYSLEELISLLDGCSKDVSEPIFRELVFKDRSNLKYYIERFSTETHRPICALDSEFVKILFGNRKDLLPELPYHHLMDGLIKRLPHLKADAEEIIEFIEILKILEMMGRDINEFDLNNENILLKYCKAKKRIEKVIEKGIEKRIEKGIVIDKAVEKVINQYLIQCGCDFNLKNIESYTKDPFEIVYKHKLLPKADIIYLLCVSPPERIALAMTFQFLPEDFDTLIREGIFGQGLPKSPFLVDFDPKLAIEHLNQRGKLYSDGDVKGLTRIFQIDIPNKTYPPISFPFHLILRKYQVWRNELLSCISSILPLPNQFVIANFPKLKEFLEAEVKRKVNELSDDIILLKELDFDINSQFNGKSAFAYYCEKENPSHFYHLEQDIVLSLLREGLIFWNNNQMPMIEHIFKTKMLDKNHSKTLLHAGRYHVKNCSNLIHHIDDTSLLEHLLSLGIHVDYLDPSDRTGSDDVSGKTALFRAIEGLNVGLVTFLLSKNADPLLSVTVNKYAKPVSPLELIYKKKHEFNPPFPVSGFNALNKNLPACEKIIQLLETAIIQKFKYCLPEKLTAFHHILKYTENNNLIELLLNAGVSVNSLLSPIYLPSPLKISAAVPSENIPAIGVGTLLHRAVDTLNIPLVEYLMSVGADVDADVEIVPLEDRMEENEEVVLTMVPQPVSNSQILIPYTPKILLEHKAASFQTHLGTNSSHRQQAIIKKNLEDCMIISKLLDGESVDYGTPPPGS